MHLKQLKRMGDSKATTRKPPKMSKMPLKMHLISTEMHVKMPKRMAPRPSTTVPILMLHCMNTG